MTDITILGFTANWNWRCEFLCFKTHNYVYAYLSRYIINIHMSEMILRLGVHLIQLFNLMPNFEKAKSCLPIKWFNKLCNIILSEQDRLFDWFNFLPKALGIFLDRIKFVHLFFILEHVWTIWVISPIRKTVKNFF